MRSLGFAATLSAVVGVGVMARPAAACSAFLFDGEAGPIVGKSYDWSEERGLLVVNKRGARKTALVLSPTDTPATWTSRFASLTFNQYGRELPNGGINEAGLVVEVLMLPASGFGKPDARPVVTELGFVQQALDVAASTPEAVALAERVRIAPAYARIHYFVCDASGACAVLEWLEGRLVAASGAALPARAITNSTYRDSQQALARGKRDASQGSLARFVRLAERLPAVAKSNPVASALELLDAVRSPDSTQWNIVYDVAARRVHFRTRNHPSIKTVALSDFPSACTQPVMMLALMRDDAGEVADAFVPYEERANAELVRATLASIRAALPVGIERRVASYPASVACVP